MIIVRHVSQNAQVITASVLLPTWIADCKQEKKTIFQEHVMTGCYTETENDVISLGSELCFFVHTGQLPASQFVNRSA